MKNCICRIAVHPIIVSGEPPGERLDVNGPAFSHLESVIAAKAGAAVQVRCARAVIMQGNDEGAAKRRCGAKGYVSGDGDNRQGINRLKIHLKMRWRLK